MRRALRIHQWLVNRRASSSRALRRAQNDDVRAMREAVLARSLNPDAVEPHLLVASCFSRTAATGSRRTSSSGRSTSLRSALRRWRRSGRPRSTSRPVSDLPKALRHLEEAEKEAPDDPEILGRIAAVYSGADAPPGLPGEGRDVVGARSRAESPRRRRSVSDDDRAARLGRAVTGRAREDRRFAGRPHQVRARVRGRARALRPRAGSRAPRPQRGGRRGFREVMLLIGCRPCGPGPPIRSSTRRSRRSRISSARARRRGRFTSGVAARLASGDAAMTRHGVVAAALAACFVLAAGAVAQQSESRRIDTSRRS